MVRTRRVRGDRGAEFRENNLGGESWRQKKNKNKGREDFYGIRVTSIMRKLDGTTAYNSNIVKLVEQIREAEDN